MPTTRHHVATAVHTLVAELVRVPVEEIRGEDRLAHDLGLDSLQSMELMSRLSETYEVDPEMDEVMGAESVADVIELIARALAVGVDA